MKDPKAIKKAIMTAKSVANLIDPHFGRVPLPELGNFGAQKTVKEHSPMVHAIYGEPEAGHFAIGGPALSAYNAARKADYEMQPESGRAIEDFIGVPPNAMKNRTWGGIMQADPLEDAYSETPSERGKLIRQQLHEQFSPVREKLRDVFGDHVTLYRHQDDTDGHHRGPRNTLSWTIDPKVADWFGGVHNQAPMRPYSDEDIEKAHQDFLRNGKIKVGRHTLVKNPESPYPEIWDDHEMVTDTESVPYYMRQENEYMHDYNRRLEGKRSKIKKAKVPLDDVIWASNRAGQKEFIVHNHPDALHYINERGEMPNLEPESEEFARGGLPTLKPAIRHRGKVYSSVVDHLSALGGITDPDEYRNARMDAENRGYVNERGRYMDRYAAQGYAKEHGLIRPDAPHWAHSTPELISENLMRYPDQEERNQRLLSGSHYAAGGEVGDNPHGIPVVGSDLWGRETRLAPLDMDHPHGLMKAYRHKIEYVPVHWLKGMRGNELRHGDDEIWEMSQDIRRHGMRNPVIISAGKNSRTAKVGEGNHRVEAADLEGFTHVPAWVSVGDTGGDDVFPKGYHHHDLIPESNRYFSAESRPSEVFRSLSGRQEYASGGYAEGGAPDQHPYAVPEDNGLYSHAAVTAAILPQAKMSPEDMRQALRGRGVKESELKWGEYDYAFGHRPHVTRDEVAKHFYATTPHMVEEKVLRYRRPGEPTVRELSDRHHAERQSFWDERDAGNMSVAEANRRRQEMNERHAAERRTAWHRNPHHEAYTIQGGNGENYREILLKSRNEGQFPGVAAHFNNEPDILASLMVKDRRDTEGNKLLHVDELQSDWAQKGRQQGFRDPSHDAYQDYVIGLRDRFNRDAPDYFRDQGYDDEQAEKAMRQYRTDPASMAHVLGETERHDELSRAAANAPKGGLNEAPYVTKTEDWVDLGLKRALLEAAREGHDKLAWSPGSTIADRYDLAKHVNSISHEKNDDGTYNLSIADPEGGTFFKQSNMTPEKVADYLGKGVAEKIFAGEGLSNEDIRERDSAARRAHLAFLDRLAENDVNNRVNSVKSEFPDTEYDPEKLQMMRDIVLPGIHRDPAHHARAQGLSDEYQDILGELKSASDDYYGLDRSRNYRHLKTDALQVGEKWPFEMYDRMIPKRALRLAKMHDPEAQLGKSKIEHDDPKGYAGFGSTDLHSIEITPRMRESILKHGFPAFAQGGEVEGYAGGGRSPNPRDLLHVTKILHDIKGHEFESSPGGVERFRENLERARRALASPIVTRGMDIVSQKPSAAQIKMSKYGKPLEEMEYKTVPKGLLHPWHEADLERMQMEGASIFPMLGDLSAADRLLLEVGGKRLERPSEQQGGGDFMRSEFSHGPDVAAYGNREGAAKDLAKKIMQQAESGRPAIGTHVAMGVGSIDSSHHAYEPILRMINVSNISDKDIADFDNVMNKMFPPTKQFPEKWPGVRNTREAERFFANRPGTHASDFVQLLDSRKWQNAGFPDVGEVRFAGSAPQLIGAPRLSSGYAFTELDPSGKVVLDPSIKHKTYPVLLPKGGKGYRGGSTHPIPLNLMFSDFYKGLKRVDKNGNPIDYESPAGLTQAMRTLQTQVPVQRATQEWLDNIMADREKREQGYKRGGTVKRALMIAKGGKKK